MADCRVCGEQTDDPGGVCWRCSTQVRPIPKIEDPPKSESQRVSGYTSRYVRVPEEGQPPQERTATIEVVADEPMISPFIFNIAVFAIILGLFYALWSLVLEDQYDRWMCKRSTVFAVRHLRSIKTELDYISNPGNAFYPETLGNIEARSRIQGYKIIYHTDDIALDGVAAGIQMVILAVPEEYCYGATVVMVDEGRRVLEAEVASEEDLVRIRQVTWYDINWDIDAGATEPSRLESLGIKFKEQAKPSDEK
jgi:hypothetical protein